MCVCVCVCVCVCASVVLMAGAAAERYDSSLSEGVFLVARVNMRLALMGKIILFLVGRGMFAPCKEQGLKISILSVCVSICVCVCVCVGAHIPQPSCFLQGPSLTPSS